MSLALLAAALSTLGAGDLAGTEPRGYEWNAPLQCPSSNSQRSEEILKIMTQKIAAYCALQNDEFRAHGYLACPNATCFEKYVEGGTAPAALSVRVQHSPTDGDFSVSIQYKIDFSRVPSDFISCWSPSEKAQEILMREKGSWDFQKYVEQCFAQ